MEKNMTIEDMKTRRDELQAKISLLLNDFSSQFGVIDLSISWNERSYANSTNSRLIYDVKIKCSI